MGLSGDKRRAANTGLVPNSAGGFAFPVDDWTRLKRFLILGSESASYYAGARTLTRENAQAVERCLAADGARAVETIVQVSEAGRAPKNDPALFALALAASVGDEATRALALAALPRVARTGTHLFQFAAAVDGLRGWGRGLRRAVARWYLDMPLDRLALQAVKYGAREGWSHRDLLRLAHPKAAAEDAGRRALFDWLCGREVEAETLPALVRATIQARSLKDERAALAELIRMESLPREAVPTEALKDAAIWDALLADMPSTALIRTLNRMTAVGLVAPGSDAAAHVLGRLRDARVLAKARVHPMQLLLAQRTYGSGRGEKGSLTWDPVIPVVDALDDAFYQAFETVEPSGKRMLVALDVSGSMGVAGVAGSSLTAREAAAAMALVTLATEPHTHVVGFTAGLPGAWRSGGAMHGYEVGISPLSLSPRQRLGDAVASVANLPFGGTDCAAPMLYALDRGLKVDAFVIYTDSETWAGQVKPVEALRRYRQATGIPAKLVVVGLVSNGFSIADPTDGGMLDVVGFDAAAPALIADFLREAE
ncbi:RNA-binding protein [Brevundimonas sp. Root1279]|nr:RNA-binding protein [Brevundimonas sp. Root1279]